MNFFQQISDVAPADLTRFLDLVDGFPEKSLKVWQQISTEFARRYTPERLQRLFESLCEYLGEPTSTTTLNMRFAYELPLTVDQLVKFPFMNLGFHSTPDGPPIEELVLSEADRKYQCNTALYRLWLRRSDLEGRDVVEVGSGRGAGASFLQRYFRPRSYTGVDGSRQQISLCSGVYREVKFLYGLASALPLADASADLVLNVESSHCYSDVEQFFQEVDRVLRPGGTFVLTDVLYQKSQVFVYLNLLDRYFDVEKKADITRNVVSCLEAHGPDQFMNLLEGMRGPTNAGSHEFLLAAARVYLPLSDNAPWANHRALSTGEAFYVSFKCKKRNA